MLMVEMFIVNRGPVGRGLLIEWPCIWSSGEWSPLPSSTAFRGQLRQWL